MLIQVGMMRDEPGWRSLLRQEGIPHTPVTPSALPAEFSAVVVSSEPSDHEVETLRAYLAGGGAVLCSGKAYSRLSGDNTKKEFSSWVAGDPGAGLFDPELVDIFSECDIPSRANALKTDGGRLSAFVGEYGGGHIVVLPFDPAALAIDRRVATKSFYSVNRRLPFERVSLVSKSGVLRLVSTALKMLHHRRGLPYVHHWYYPYDQQSVFALRIDTDYAAQPEIERLRDLARREDFPLTWFVDVGSQKNFLSLFREFRGDEVGVHCFHHRAYREPEALAENIRRAVHEFESAGLTARSYAAPYGLWDISLARAVEQFKFCYTSEFSYDYDNLPSYPSIDRRFISTLQIPIHPISVGSLRRQGFREDEMSSYFRSAIDRKVRLRQPVFLYHHPKNGHPKVLEEIFALVKEKGIQPLRMIDYGSWWRKRDCGGLRIALEGSSLRVRIQSGPTSTSPFATGGAAETPLISGQAWLHIIRPDGMEAFQKISPAVELEDLEWRKPPEPPPLPADIIRIRKFNPWISIIRAEDRLAGLFKS